MDENTSHSGIAPESLTYPSPKGSNVLYLDPENIESGLHTSPPVRVEDLKRLREESGASPQDCKKALVKTLGDYEAAFDLLRRSGWGKEDAKD
jgi:lipoate-protein ligase A